MREWDKEHIKMSKGITLSKDGMIKLKEILNAISIESIFVNNNESIEDIIEEM